MLLTNVSVASAEPPIPSTFHGTVKVDGMNVAIGTLITAWIDGVQYATYNAALSNTDTVYALIIPGDDASTVGVIEGGVAGDTVDFKIGDLTADQQGIWTGGSSVTLNLTASSAVNVAPVLDEIGNKSIAELTELSFTATATDVDNPVNTLTFSLAAGTGGAVPAGATITTGGVFTWTPTEAQGPGPYTFDVCVSDGALNDCETITVTVSEVNVAPILDPIGDKHVEEGHTLTFTATASDEDLPANTLTFSLVGAPAGATIDAVTGEFSWTPYIYQLPGDYSFQVCVSDLVDSDCESITVTIDAYLALTDLDLLQSTDLVGPWTLVPGDYITGFTMVLDPGVPYYYLDVANLVTNRILADDYYPFVIQSAPAGFLAYWDALGVNALASGGWEEIMWDIINGDLPFFYLKVSGSGTSFDLIDGLDYILYPGEDKLLKVNGTYLIGEYMFAGRVSDTLGYTDDVSVDITFVEPLDVTDVGLSSSADYAPWTPVAGNLSEGYEMLLDTAVEYYYLDASSVTGNRPLAEGLYPFFITSHPADFFTYWAGKGVVSGATGWQGVMWEIINGNQPMFYLRVSEGSDYELVDGLTYLMSSVEVYLKINGTYLPGVYAFSGVVADTLGSTDAVLVEIEFNDIPVANDQSLTTPMDTQLPLTLTGSDFTIDLCDWIIVTDVTHGTLICTDEGCTYTPDAGYIGNDFFEFKINDGEVDSNIARVDISVTGYYSYLPLIKK